MKLTPTLRFVALALVVFVATAAIWWLVGFQIGKGILEDAGGGATWRVAYGFRNGGAARLLFLAVLALLSAAVANAVVAEARWPVVAALALLASLVLGVRGGELAGTVLFVVAASAPGEGEGAEHLFAALVLGIAVAFAEVLDAGFTTGQAALAVLLRGLLYWLPLLAGPSLAERWVIDRAVRARG